jgi:hypothetical protein
MRRKKKKGEEDIPEHGGEEKELRREEKKKKWILMFFTCGGKEEEEEEEEEERRRVCYEIRDSRNFLSVIPIVIDMMNSVHSLPTVLPTGFTDTSTFFFCFVLIILFPTIIPSVYTEGILPSVYFRQKYSLGISICIY